MDRKQFESRFALMKGLHRGRLKRALSIMPPENTELLNLLPIFLNYNHPLIPGYKPTLVPYGIDGFVPNESQENYLRQRGIDPKLKVRGEYSIYGLYSMGSTSSVVQGADSDLDIWVCISKEIPQDRVRFLTEKCSLISAYAKALGVELNLFVTSEDKFTNSEHGTMDTEDCGSAQSLFLLDEFYRSAIYLCGRKLAWFMISVEEELDDYQKNLDAFYQKDYVNKDEWFDFGTIANSSPSEYFGSGLWLVYKGIDHPYKALMKIILMEAYSAEYPNTRMLSLNLKAITFGNGFNAFKQDPYYLMFKKISSYLLKNKDFKRLNLVKECFFLKLLHSALNIPQSNEQIRRIEFLRRVANIWHWDAHKVNQLKQIFQSKFAKRQSFHVRLYASLMQSYQALLQFSLKHNIEHAITSDDAGVLSRKIFASFDRYPGKIIVYHNELGDNQSEEKVSFIYPSESNQLNKSWYAYTAALDDLDLLSNQAIYAASSLTQVIAWAVANKVIGLRTKLQVYPNYFSYNSQNVRALASDLHRFYKQCSYTAKESSLNRPREFIKIFVAINFEEDITRQLSLSESDLATGTALSCGRQNICLIGSVEMLSLNSWGEFSYTSFAKGEEGIIDLLASLAYSRGVKNLESPISFLDNIYINCYAGNHKNLIEYDLTNTIKGVFSCLEEHSHNYTFEIANNNYEAYKDDNGEINIQRLSKISPERDTMILSRFGMRPEFAMQVPALVSSNASLGIVQYFFMKKRRDYDIYIVNEKNEVRIFKHFRGSRTELVNAINRFYTNKTSANDTNRVMGFNLPQYFVIDYKQNSIHPFTIVSD